VSFDLELAPKQKRPAGERCCEPVVYPDVEREQAIRIAEVAKALGDPTRVARRRAPQARRQGLRL
jgi:ArsR family transcriptional regulator